MNANRIATLAAAAAATSLLVGCTRTVPYRQESRLEAAGPADHAPLAPGAGFVFDAELGVYRVVGHENRYYSAGQYFRRSDAGWEWSVRMDGPWREIVHECDVPPGLRHRTSRRSAHDG